MRHLGACDVEAKKLEHAKRAQDARAQEKADALAAKVESEDPTEIDNADVRHATDLEQDLEREISDLLAEQSKRGRLETAALACTTWRENLFMPDSHVTQVKDDITEYCDSGVDLAAKKLAARFGLQEEEVKSEIGPCFGDYKELGGTKKEKGVANRIIEPVHPACETRVLGTRRDVKGNLVEVALRCLICLSN